MAVAACIVLVALVALEGWLHHYPLRDATLDAAVADSNDLITRAMHLALTSDRERGPIVAAIGGSISHAIYGTPSDFEAQLTALGAPNHFLSLVTTGQTATEALALASSLTLPRGSMLLVQISADRLLGVDEAERVSAERPRMPFLDYGAARAEQGASAHDLRPMLLVSRNWLGYYARRRAEEPYRACRRAEGGRVRCVVTGIAGAFARRTGGISDAGQAAPLDLQDKLLRRRQYELVYAARERTPSSIATREFARLAVLGRDRGWRVVFVHYPVDPLWRPVIAGYDSLLNQRIGELQSLGATYLDLRDAAGFGSDDFFDLEHVTTAGSEHLTRLLAQWVAHEMTSTTMQP
ncbi:MAG TPA: hypothetical protein VGM67_02485 [Gemmatimonadaceae bacterium]|jgi:hypothetical protein